MKLRITLAVAAVLFLGNAAWAQEAPAADIFAGYSFISIDGGTDRETSHGWLANVGLNVHPNVGIVGDVGGHYEEGVDLLEYLGGVRFNGRASGVNPFAQALIGGVRFSFDGGGSDNFFALGFGGGIDIPASDAISVRAVQFDWIPVYAFDEWETSPFRLGFGVVFHIQ